MDLQAFGALIERLETRARARPRLYRAQVALLAALGYGYILALLVALVAILAGLGYLMIVRGGGLLVMLFMFPVGTVAWACSRALWVRLPDASGISLTADRVPELFAAIERVRATLDIPRIRRVLLDGEIGASVTQHPRFGIMGPCVNDLVVGLPLFHALSAAEFESVLAHEMGHLSRQHGRFGHWIHRLRGTWGELDELSSHQDGKLVRVLVGRFASWYARFFNAYTFVLARQAEYEADDAAVRVAGPSAAASALVHIAVADRFEERYRESVEGDLYRGIDVTTPYADFVAALAKGVTQADAERWLAEVLRRPTDLVDSHPSLADRLRAIGADQPQPGLPVPASSAAATLLGEAADALVAELDAQWWADAQPELTALRASRDTAMRRLAQLEALPTDVDVAWERVTLLAQLDRKAEARAAADALVAEHPEHPLVHFFLGEIRIEADEPEGIALLERAAVLYPLVAAGAYGLIFDYHWRHGRREEAELARAAWDDAAERLERAMHERDSLPQHAAFLPHDLRAETIERWRQCLAEVPGLRAVYLVRREVVEIPETPCYLVGVVPEVRWWERGSAAERERLSELVSNVIAWPPSACLLLGNGRYAAVVRRMSTVPGAVLFDRTPHEVPIPATALEPGH